MNIKKLIFNITAFFLITNAQVVYTKDQQDDNNKSQISVNDDNNDSLQNNTEHNEETWKFIEETLLSVTDQTQKIEFCLQTIEQIINADKIKFNNQETKSQVLFNIKNIKLIIQKLFTVYTTQITNKEESIFIGTCYNIAFIEYLLPVFQNDITTINVETLATFIETNIDRIMDTNEPLIAMIENNETNITLLMKSSDSVGLSTLNKVYRYLDTKPLPWYGKSTLATAYDVALWSSAALLGYSTITYGLSKNSPIYGCQDWKISDLPGKSFLGDYHEVEQLKQSMTPDERKVITNDFGAFSYLHDGMNTYTNPFMLGCTAILAYLIKKPILETYESTNKKLNHGINYYLKGDISTPKNTNIIPKAYFSDMVGGEHLEKLAQELTDYLKNPTRYERAGITPSTGYLLVGPSQTGKSFFAKALKTMVDEAFEGSNEEVKFLTITADDLKYFGGFNDIFYWARKNGPVILFMDEIDMFGTRRDRDAKTTQELLTAMNGIDTDSSKKVIVIAATNKPEELDFALKQKGRLGTTITFDVPTYECRKAYLEKQLHKKNIVLNQEIVDTIAQETNNQTYNMIDDIIRQSLQLATFETRPVTENDFEITLDREIRRIKPSTSISPQEKELIAIYQAGQAAARHILATDQQIVKITVDSVDKPMKSKEGFGVVHEQKGEQHENHDLLPETRTKPTRLGFVFTMSKTNNQELVSDDDQEQELLALLAGQAALELIKGKTFNGFGKEDRAKVIETLEKKISQGTPITNEIRQQALVAKEILYNQVKATLEKHVNFIKIIRDKLIKNNTINTQQWLELTANYIL